MRRVWWWLRARRAVAAYLLVVGMGAYGLWSVDTARDDLGDEVRARETQNCERGNEGRVELRHALAVVLTNNLVEAASEPPDPAVVDAFRRGLLDDLETEFPDRRC